MKRHHALQARRKTKEEEPGLKAKSRLLAFPDGPGREERLQSQHGHRPGAHLHCQAAAVVAALHLLGNANLGHLHIKLVPRKHYMKECRNVG